MLGQTLGGGYDLDAPEVVRPPPSRTPRTSNAGELPIAEEELSTPGAAAEAAVRIIILSRLSCPLLDLKTLIKTRIKPIPSSRKAQQSSENAHTHSTETTHTNRPTALTYPRAGNWTWPLARVQTRTPKIYTDRD